MTEPIRTYDASAHMLLRIGEDSQGGAWVEREALEQVTRERDELQKWVNDAVVACARRQCASRDRRHEETEQENADLRARLARAEAVLATVRHWKAGPMRDEPCWCGAVEERSHHRWCRILLSTYRKATGTAGGTDG